MTKCKGCGIKKQKENIKNPGYTSSLKNDYCNRCYDLIHFNKMYNYDISGETYITTVKDVVTNYETVILVIDICNIHSSMNEEILKIIQDKKVILVVNKMDIFPKNVRRAKISDWLDENFSLDIEEIIFTSATKKHAIDDIINCLKKLNIKSIPILGVSNVGKSSIINAMIRSVKPNEQTKILTSYFLGTTVEPIHCMIDNIEIIDTPGLINHRNLQTYMDKENMKKLLPKKEYKPIILQKINKASIFISSACVINCNSNQQFDCSIYVSPNVKIHRTKHEKVEDIIQKHKDDSFFGINISASYKYNNYNINLNPNQMIYIDGLCWIIFNNKNNVEIDLKLLDLVDFGVYPSLFKE